MTKKTGTTRRLIDVLAVLLVIAGFGLLHNKSRSLEVAGSIFIGMGSLYWMIRLLLSYRTGGKSQPPH